MVAIFSFSVPICISRAMNNTNNKLQTDTPAFGLYVAAASTANAAETHMRMLGAERETRKKRNHAETFGFRMHAKNEINK